MGVYFHDLGLGSSLLAMTPKAQATKGGEKNRWIGFYKDWKLLCFKWNYQESEEKVYGKNPKNEKIFANHISDKRVVSSIYKEILHLNK